MSQSKEDEAAAAAAAAARSRRAGAAASHHRAGRYEEAAALLEASLADLDGGDGGDGGGDRGGDRGGGGLSPPRDDAASVADRLDRAAAEHNLGLAREGMRAAALRRRRRRRRRRAEAGGGAAAGSAPSSASSTSEADAGAGAGAGADADADADADAGADADSDSEDAEDGDEGPSPCFLRAADLYREAQAALAGGRVRDAALREYDDEAAAASAAAAGRGGAEAAPTARWACPERGAALSLLAAAGACAREGDVDGAVACHEEVVGLLLGEDEAEAEAEGEGEGEGEESAIPRRPPRGPSSRRSRRFSSFPPPVEGKEPRPTAPPLPLSLPPRPWLPSGPGPGTAPAWATWETRAS